MAPKLTDKTVTRRAENAALRRRAIIDAALDEFVEKGFAAARVDDIARRAGVAKGTIYLNFSDKESLFEAIVRQEIRPKIDAAASVAAAGGSLRDFLGITLLPALGDLVRTRRGAVLRLMVGEAGRFPKLAEVYYRVVIHPGLESIGALVQRSRERGELSNDALVEFPQLLVAPMLLAVLWTGLFEKFRTLDVERMAHAYFEHILGVTPVQRSAFGPQTR